MSIRHRLVFAVLCLFAAPLILASGCSMLAPLPPETSLVQRLAAFPTNGLPLEKPAMLRWNEHQIPYIEAASDNDAAFLLGMVHAHLRLAQLEVAKRLSQGRMSELGGPSLEGLDRAMRAIDFGYATRDMYDAMDPDTRRWLSRFVDGINHYKNQLEKEEYPHEMRVLAVGDEPWTVLDVLTLGRLASIDVNWISFYTLLSIEDPEKRETVRKYLVDVGLAGAVSFAGEGGVEATELIMSHAKPGSNSVAVAGSHTETGAALMANDPHLGMLLPNFWLIAGLECPSIHAVGFMLPGVPVFAIGRNEHISWGGTNMRALSSDLVDVSNLPDDAF
ncbi:MAG: penicillin acylase family protein, partial [Oceanidesulfovibrio sp.]